MLLARKDIYSSQQTHNKLTQLFRKRFGTDPGAGKMMPFMMPLLLDKTKKVIIVSPLKVLQADQVHICLIPAPLKFQLFGRLPILNLSAAIYSRLQFSLTRTGLTSPLNELKTWTGL
jgi:hypothetical protein